MEVENKFEYRPKFVFGLLAAALFGLLAYGNFHIATTNTTGLVLFKVLRFSPSETNYLYWALFALFLCGVGLGVMAVVRSLMPPRFVTLRTDEIESPKGSTYHGMTTVKYEDIQSISVNKAGKALVLQVTHTNGKLKIPEKVFKDKSTFLGIGNQLQQLCNK